MWKSDRKHHKRGYSVLQIHIIFRIQIRITEIPGYDLNLLKNELELHHLRVVQQKIFWFQQLWFLISETI